MNTKLLVIAVVSMALNGGFFTAVFLYRRRYLRADIQMRQARNRSAQLRRELAAEAPTQVISLCEPTPAPLPRRDDPLEQLWLTPAVEPGHERNGRQ